MDGGPIMGSNATWMLEPLLSNRYDSKSNVLGKRDGWIDDISGIRNHGMYNIFMC